MRDWPLQVTRRFPIAVFLDRDGTINEDTHYPHRLKELALIDGVEEGLRTLAGLPVHLFVVSNQAGIAKGLFTVSDMRRFNQELHRRVMEAGGRIDAFYYCPHFEPKDLAPGTTPCTCSKPNSGLLLEAAQDYRIDLKRSFMIGDKMSDVAAGQRAGTSTVLLLTGKAGTDGCRVDRNPDAIHENLADAAVWIAAELSRTTVGTADAS